MDDEFIDPNSHYGNSRDDLDRGSAVGSPSQSKGLSKTLVLLVYVVAIAGFYLFYNGYGVTAWPGAIDREKIAPGEVADLDREREEVGAEKFKEVTGLDLATSADWERDEIIAANRSKVEELKRQLVEISAFANRNTESLVSTQAKISKLLTSAEGMKIGTQNERVLEFIGLQKKTGELTANLPASDSFVSDVTALLKRVSAAGDAGYSPNELLFNQAKAYLDQHSKKSEEILLYSTAVDRLIEATSGLKPGPTLAIAIENQNEEDARKLSERLASIRRDASKRKRTRLGDAEKKRLDAEIDLAAARLNAKTQGLIFEKKGVLDQAAKLKLEKEFAAAEPEIRSYLAYLLVDGRSHRGSASGMGPVSYNAVVSSGATTPGKNGTIAMSRWIGSNGLGWNGHNNRAKDSSTIILNDFLYTQPKYESSIQFAEKAQALLQKFGQLMVEKGLLED